MSRASWWVVGLLFAWLAFVLCLPLVACTVDVPKADRGARASYRILPGQTLAEAEIMMCYLDGVAFEPTNNRCDLAGLEAH